MQTPTYLVKNHNGIFYFRCRIPAHLHQFFPNNKSEFRKSLKTRNKRDAVKLARIMWVNMNNQYTPFGFGLDFDNLEFFTYEEYLKEQKLKAASEENSSNTKPTGPELILSEAVEKFINEKKFKKLVPKSLDTYQRMCQLLIDVIGDKPVNEVTKQDIIKYKETLLLLPKNRNKPPKYGHLTLAEILELDIPKEDKLSTTTIKDTIVKVSSFLRWCKDNFYFGSDFSSVFNEMAKASAAPEECKANFTLEDIEKMFLTSEYQDTGFKGWAFRYWVPILALYSGARLNEISQLHVKDVYVENNINVILLHDFEDDHKIKNKKSRIIPIHKKLIELGFLTYVDYVKKKQEKQLFPQLTQDYYGSYSRKAGRFFNEKYESHKGFMVYAGVEKKSTLGKKSFHSFRHTFLNAAKQLGLNERIVKEIAGHSTNDITFDTYGKGYSIEIKKKEIDKIKFDVKHPIKWERRFY